MDILQTLGLLWGDLAGRVVLRMADRSLMVVGVHCDVIFGADFELSSVKYFTFIQLFIRPSSAGDEI